MNPVDAPVQIMRDAHDDSGHTYASELADMLSPDKETVLPLVVAVGEDEHHYTNRLTLRSLQASGTGQHERYEQRDPRSPRSSS